MCRYSWHSAGYMGWLFPMLKYKYMFQIKYTEAILSNGTRKLLWVETNKMLIAFRVSHWRVLGVLRKSVSQSVDMANLLIRH